MREQKYTEFIKQWFDVKEGVFAITGGAGAGKTSVTVQIVLNAKYSISIVNIDDFTTVDVSDATGYADVELTGEAVNKDDGNNRAEFDANNISFAGLSGDATRDYQGVLLYKYVDGTDANDLVIAFVEFDNQPLAKEATQLDVPWDTEGIMQLA